MLISQKSLGTLISFRMLTLTRITALEDHQRSLETTIALDGVVAAAALIGRTALTQDVGNPAGNIGQAVVRMFEEVLVPHAGFGATYSDLKGGVCWKIDARVGDLGIEVVGADAIG